MPILDSDFAAWWTRSSQADPDWRAAMARRGLTRHAARSGPARSPRARIGRAPTTTGAGWSACSRFLQAGEHDLAWAHPVDGVAAYVDLIEKKVFKVTDEFELPVPAESGDYDDEAVRGPHRTTLQAHRDHPAGGAELHPGRARAALAGLVDADRLRRPGGADPAPDQPRRAGRPVIYRASIPEMVVPYGDPRFRYWQAYFDTGEYLVGKWANSLELGCDCLGEIAYLDATVTDDTGQPRTIPNAICIHEEDFGILWKHTDIFNGSAQSRRQRRLVVSYFTTVGNYDYGFYWYFYLDGTIECEIKATGVLFTSAYPGGDHPYSTEVAPGLAAPGAPAPVQRAAGHDRGRAGQRGRGGRRQRPADRAGQPVRQRDRAAGDPVDPRVAGGPPYGRRPRAGSGGSSAPSARTGSASRPASRCTRSPRRPCWPIPASPLARAGRVRHQPPVGDPVRPGAALPGRRLREPEPRRSGHARLHRGRPGHRRRRTSSCGTRSGRRTSRARRTGR